MKKKKIVNKRKRVNFFGIIKIDKINFLNNNLKYYFE